MSISVILIGIAHGIPVVVASAMTQSRTATILSAISMSFVAITLGGSQYVGIDLICVAIGVAFGWSIIEKPLSTLKHQIDEAISLNQRYDYFADRLFDKWICDGLIEPLSDQKTPNTQQRQTFRKYVRWNITGVIDQKLEVFFEELIPVIGKQYKKIFDDFMVVHAAVDEGLVNLEFLRQYKISYAEEKFRLEVERREKLRVAMFNFAMKLQKHKEELVGPPIEKEKVM
jgi:hypothetical protein